MKSAKDAALEIGWNRSPIYFVEGKNPMSFTLDELAAIIRDARNEALEAAASRIDPCIGEYLLDPMKVANRIRAMKEE